MGLRFGQIQIVTDETVLLLAVSRAYRNKPVDVVTATNTDQALTQLSVFNFDLFLLDLDMKDGCSLGLLETMTERFPSAPVILMTTGDTQSPELADKIKAIRFSHCWHLLAKPFDYKKLVGVIDLGLQEHSLCMEKQRRQETIHLEKRRCQRFSRFEPINISMPHQSGAACQTQPILATLTDISVSGMGVAIIRSVPQGTTVTFDEKFMHQSGVVVWNQKLEDQTWQSGIKFI